MDQIRRPQEGAHPARSHGATGETKPPGTAASAAKRPEARRRVGADVSNKRPAPSAFQSILFQNPERYPAAETAGEPDCFGDLNLDQTMASLTAGRDEYELLGYFHTSMTDVDDVAYRHEIMRDLDDGALASRIRSFADSMTTMRKHLVPAQKLHYRLQQESWFLTAVDSYCSCVAELSDFLSQGGVKSRGMQAFAAYIANYVASSRFQELRNKVQALNDDLATVHYCVFLFGDGFRVHRYRDETDYSADVEEAFAKFRQGNAKDYRSKMNDWVEMNHVEEKILEFVSQLWPEIFARLAQFFQSEWGAFPDKKIVTFDRQVQFYLAYAEHMKRMEKVGLSFSYPVVSAEDKSVRATDAFDIALAAKLAADGGRVVSNDFELSGKERILVVSGPNQGGKTTFSRTCGQMHYLASLGLPVPGREARLFLFDTIFTHFEREEDITNLRGKLQDDLVRVHDILDRATPRSIVIMNEIFTSTTLQDATFLSEKVMERIMDLDLICVWVTFIHELSRLGEKTVSMVSTVDPTNPDKRTYKVVRKEASGRSYAMSIAEKYGLTEERLKERIGK
jgi:hypothetical protein